MTKIYENKWIQKIVDLQYEDGSWGYFHSLSQPTKKQPMTTEQALKRLWILGLTKDDESISRALQYMRDCLAGKRQLPDKREKVLNWDAFETHMLATWIRLFDPNDLATLPIVKMWAEIITQSFRNGSFNEDTYATHYRKHIPILHKGERRLLISQYYMVNLLKGQLDKETESHFVNYIINNPSGIYYVYSAKIADLPIEFASRNASFYLAALEQLVGYSCAGEKLRFAMEWILSYKDENDEWDMGTASKDGIYFPLSDSWRKQEDRKRDCTDRIYKLLNALE